MTAQAPLDRLAPRDFYRQLDWIRDEWATRDEFLMTRRLERLRRLFEHLPTRYWMAARPLLQELGWARIANGRPWQAMIRSLADIAAEWDRARPPLLVCPECRLDVRGHAALKTHRYVVHEVEDAA